MNEKQMEKQPIPKQMTPLYYTIPSFVRILNLEKEDVNVGQSIKKFVSKVQKVRQISFSLELSWYVQWHENTQDQ